MSDRGQEGTGRDNRCRKAWLPEARKKGWCCGPDAINYRTYIGAGPLRVSFPIRYRFMQIKNRMVVTETDLIKQGNVASKLFPNEDLVVSPHCNDKIGSLS